MPSPMKIRVLAAVAFASVAALSACTTEANEAPVGADEIASRSQLAPTCFSPPKHDCRFYAECLEATKPCGAQGYALGYGGRYCKRFLDNEALSEAGAVWRDEVMVCLQKRAGRFLDNTPATCTEITDGAFDDHPGCYTQPHASICALPASDWLSIVWTIDHEDLLSGRGRRQISATARTCLEQWTGVFASPFGGADVVARREVADTEGEVAQRRAIVEALAHSPSVGFETLRALTLLPVVDGRVPEDDVSGRDPAAFDAAHP
jgi:hypothetical protein